MNKEQKYTGRDLVDSSKLLLERPADMSYEDYKIGRSLQKAAVKQYLRVAKSEGLDPEQIWAEVMEFSETAPDFEDVKP